MQTSVEVWDDILARSPGDFIPEPPFVNFVGTTLSGVCNAETGEPVPFSDIRFLDIGCGKSARHTDWLERKGYNVTAIDISHKCRAHYHCDVNDLHCTSDSFQCVMDIKTLCAVEHPPWNKIYTWIQPDFYLYSMCPTDRHLKEEGGWDVTQGLPYMRMASKEEIQDLFHMYREVRIREHFRPCSINEWTSTWCIEAMK